jgi:PAS domain S-box-containing protein
MYLNYKNNRVKENFWLLRNMRQAQSGRSAQNGGPQLGVLRLIVCAASAAAGLVGLVALVGWLAGLPLATNWEPHLASMKPVTALAILLIASAILPQLPLAPRWRIAFGAIAALLGALSLMQDFGVPFRLQFWFPPAAPGAGSTLLDLRMSSAAALAVLLAGTAAAFLPISRLADAARFLAAGAGVIGAIALLSHVLSIDVFSLLPFNSVALPTVAALITICAAVLVHGQLSSPPRSGDFRLFLSQFLVPLLIFALFAGWSWRNVEAEASASAERTAASFSEYAQRVFEIQETALEAVLDHVKGRNPADIAADRSVHEFMSRIDEHTHTSDAIVLVRSDNGRVIASSRGFPAPEVDVSQRDYFKALHDGYQGVFIGKVINAMPFSGIGFTISRRDPATGIIAVAYMSIDSFKQLSAVKASPRDALTLARADGMALALYPPPADPVGFRLHEDGVTMELLNGEAEAGIIAPSGVDHVERLWQFRRVGHYPVYAIYGLDVVLVRAAWLRQIIPFGLVTLLASALTYSLSRRWQSAVEDRRRALNEAEVARVRAERAEALARVEQARDDLLQLAERSYEFIAIADLDGRITYINSAGKRMTGRDLERDSRGLHVGEFIAPESLGYFNETFMPTVRRQGQALAEMKLRNLTSGEMFDVIYSAFLLFDRKGNPNQLATVIRDITDRKRHEEHLNLLMHEVNHRAKNMLSLVQAISHQTAAKSPRDFLARFAERLQALAANQDLLVRNEWAGVGIADLVRAQLAAFADLIGSRILVHGPKLRLNAAAAQAVGLALHELATNASKYGALSSETGSVEVCWRNDGDAFAMNWTERGGPPVSPPKQRGFGSTVVSLMAERSVDGEVRLDYAPSGVTWTLTCPSASALEALERVELERSAEKRQAS